jgi:hypothetical protein
MFKALTVVSPNSATRLILRYRIASHRTGALLAFYQMLLNAAAALILLVTDQPGSEKARAVKMAFETTAPFSKMPDLDLQIVSVSSDELGCESATPSNFDLLPFDGNILAFTEWRDRIGLAIDAKRELPFTCKETPKPQRLIDCDTPKARAFLSALKQDRGAEFALVIKNDPRYGGSGGLNPVITTGSPELMAIHEFMHRLGFADEYEFTTDCEADLYCVDSAKDQDVPSNSGYGNLPGWSFNVPRFNSLDSYDSNKVARRAHGKLVPWLPLISRDTLLVTGRTLGSPESVRFGLHRAVVCNKATERSDTWRAENADNVMHSLHTNYIPELYWETIARSLGTTIDSGALNERRKPSLRTPHPAPL